MHSWAKGFEVPNPALQIKLSQKLAHDNYLRFLKDFDKKHCDSSTEYKYNQLVQARKKLTNYVPELYSGELDAKTIKDGLSDLDKKWQWLVGVREQLKKLNTWPNRKTIFKPIESSIEKLLNLKEQKFLNNDNSKKLQQASKRELDKLKSQYESLMTDLFFLKGFNYPVDHLKQRQLFEDYYYKDAKTYTQKANEVMFLRRLEEDGTTNDKNDNSDLYLRTTLNTISIKLKQKDPWLDEEVRHDLEWAIRRIDQQLSYGKNEQINRIQNWINRTAGIRSFYLKILDKKGSHEELQEFINKREAGKKLKDFVYTKNAQVYKFLLDQDEYIQAYFVFDQVLLHEVGAASVYNFRDRQDVAKVFTNSRFHPKLSIIEKSEDMYKYLIEAGVSPKDLATPSWLNAMFKALRFSFTLYYIPAVKHVFCPDFYKTAQSTRSKNLYLIWDSLKKPDTEFKALRYFSRWSMLGRIDMSDVWSDYLQIPERAGSEYKSDKDLQKKFKGKAYRYLYSFIDPQEQLFHVLEIANKNYAVKIISGQPRFFAYRDTHHFRFYQQK